MRNIERVYIDGTFVAPHGQERMNRVNPTTGKVMGYVVLGDQEDARLAIAAATAAFPAFSRTTKEQRTRYLQRLHEVVAARAGDLTAAMVEEYGGTLAFCRASSERAASSFLTAAAALKETELTKRVGTATVTLEAVGVVGIITPWNASSSFICGKLASALAAGCTAVIKPSELSSLQTQVLLECLHQAGLPPGVFNVVNGLGEVVGAELTRNPQVAKISFTGSTAVGKAILRDGAETMKRVTLELGGKSANVLLDDVDLDVAIPLALSLAFMNNGQACIAGTRLLVPTARLPEVKEALVRAMRSVRVGDPANDNTTLGPLATQKQWDRVQGYIKRGVEEGAELLLGGEGLPPGVGAGYFVKPTVFTGVKNDMAIAREEIFGPVLSVLTYETEAEAVELANDTAYGLAAYVSARDHARASRVASQLVAGRVSINGLYDEPMAPFGGFKQSGVGREFGTYGLSAYLEAKATLG